MRWAKQVPRVAAASLSFFKVTVTTCQVEQSVTAELKPLPWQGVRGGKCVGGVWCTEGCHSVKRLCGEALFYHPHWRMQHSNGEGGSKTDGNPDRITIQCAKKGRHLSHSVQTIRSVFQWKTALLHDKRLLHSKDSDLLNTQTQSTWFLPVTGKADCILTHWELYVSASIKKNGLWRNIIEALLRRNWTSTMFSAHVHPILAEQHQWVPLIAPIDSLGRSGCSGAADYNHRVGWVQQATIRHAVHHIKRPARDTCSLLTYCTVNVRWGGSRRGLLIDIPIGLNGIVL